MPVLLDCDQTYLCCARNASQEVVHVSSHDLEAEGVVGEPTRYWWVKLVDFWWCQSTVVWHVRYRRRTGLVWLMLHGFFPRGLAVKSSASRNSAPLQENQPQVEILRADCSKSHNSRFSLL